MDVPILLTADYANVANDGKLNVMGIFTNIKAFSFPALHPQMYLIAQLSGGRAEYNRKFKLEIKLLNEDATLEVVNRIAEAQLPQGENGQLVNLNIILSLSNIVFPTPGTYEFSILVDNDVKGTLPLEIILIAQDQ
ncbi:MAG: hypothetical protein ABI690_19095 [Chloroflexota bacterium]